MCSAGAEHVCDVKLEHLVSMNLLHEGHSVLTEHELHFHLVVQLLLVTYPFNNLRPACRDKAHKAEGTCVKMEVGGERMAARERMAGNERPKRGGGRWNAWKW